MPAIITIDDPDDPRIAAYRDIRERDLVGRQGFFVAEGRVVLAMLVASQRYRPKSVLIAAHRASSLADLLESIEPEVPVFSAAQPVIDQVAGFPLHRGILAIGERKSAPDADTLLKAAPPGADVVVLSGIANHDNMGGIFRNAAAFETAAILLDADCCDPLYRKAIRVSVGASLLVPFAKLPRGTDVPALLQRYGFAPLALSPAGTYDLAEFHPPARSALILGAEGPGLDPAMLACATTVAIPMPAGFDSLNVATTSGIALHHLAATRRRRKQAMA